jgi:hypothetical protein
VLHHLLPNANHWSWSQADHDALVLLHQPNVQHVFEHFKEFLLLSFQIYAGIQCPSLLQQRLLITSVVDDTGSSVYGGLQAGLSLSFDNFTQLTNDLQLSLLG